MYFPREFKDKRIAKLERQLEFADSLHKADCDDFYHLFKDELDESQERIAELEAKVAELEQRNDKLAAFSLSLIVDRNRP